MSDALKPPLHGRDHRPVHFNGPTDPGGADPWCDWNDVKLTSSSGWGTGRYIGVDVVLPTIPTDTTYVVDFTGWTASSNDTGPTDPINQHESSPFTGDNFSINWALDPYAIRINTEGVYFVHRYFAIQTLAGSPSQPFDMEMVASPGLSAPWMLANNPGNIVKSVSNNASIWEIRETFLYVVSGGASRHGLNVIQRSGFDATGAITGISILRLGSTVVQ